MSIEIELVCLLRKINFLFKVQTFARWLDIVGSGGKGEQLSVTWVCCGYL